MKNHVLFLSDTYQQVIKLGGGCLATEYRQGERQICVHGACEGAVDAGVHLCACWWSGMLCLVP